MSLAKASQKTVVPTRKIAHRSSTCISPLWAPTTKYPFHHNMVGARPCSTSADPGQNPARHPRFQLDQPAQHDLEGSTEPSSHCLTSVIFLASGSALQLPLDDFDLLLEPQPTPILQLSLPGHPIFLVPEGHQDSTWPEHPEFSPFCPLGSALLNMPRDLIVIQQGPFSALVRNSEGLQNASPSGMT